MHGTLLPRTLHSLYLVSLDSTLEHGNAITIWSPRYPKLYLVSPTLHSNTFYIWSPRLL
ncbi:unnamed protein product, partial [Staurois parvus]